MREAIDRYPDAIHVYPSMYCSCVPWKHVDTGWWNRNDNFYFYVRTVHIE
jgi:hypothetical protein